MPSVGRCLLVSVDVVVKGAAFGFAAELQKSGKRGLVVASDVFFLFVFFIQTDCLTSKTEIRYRYCRVPPASCCCCCVSGLCWVKQLIDKPASSERHDPISVFCFFLAEVPHHLFWPYRHIEVNGTDFFL